MRSSKGVYKPQANYLVKAIRKLPMFHDQAVNQLPAFASLPLESCPLVMPMSADGVRVVYVVYEYDPLIDSSDMTMDDWMGIGRDIQVSVPQDFMTKEYYYPVCVRKTTFLNKNAFVVFEIRARTSKI